MKKRFILLSVLAVMIEANATITNLTTYQTNLFRTEVTWNGKPGSNDSYFIAYYDAENHGTYSDHNIHGGSLTAAELKTSNANEYTHNTYSLFNILPANDDFEGIAWDYYNGSKIAMLPGTWYVAIEGWNRTTGKTTEAEVIVPFTIKSYEVDPESISFVANSDNTKATLNLTVPEMLAGNWLDVWVTLDNGDETVTVVYESNGTSTPSFPITVDIEEGKVYSVGTQVMAPLDVELAANPTPNGYVVSKEFAIGENLTVPINLSAVVENDDEVVFSWSAAKDSPRYRLVVTKDGVEALNEVINGKNYVSRFYPATYSWSVTAMVFNTTTYEFDDDMNSVATGDDFTTADTKGPQILDFTVKDITETSAVLVLDATDNWDNVEDFVVSLWWSINGGTGIETPNLHFDKNGEMELPSLQPATEYSIAVSVKDLSGNQDQREEKVNEMGFTYTEMHHVEFKTLGTIGTGVEELTDASVVYRNEVVENVGHDLIRLYNAAGQKVAETRDNIDMQQFVDGIYILKTSKGTEKIVK